MRLPDRRATAHGCALGLGQWGAGSGKHRASNSASSALPGLFDLNGVGWMFLLSELSYCIPNCLFGRVSIADRHPGIPVTQDRHDDPPALTVGESADPTPSNCLTSVDGAAERGSDARVRALRNGR